MRVDNTSIGLEKGNDVKIWCSNHPVLAHKLTKLRDVKTDCNTFRHILREVTFYLGYEATQDLQVTPVNIRTPLAPHLGKVLSSTVSLVPILRAGLGMVESMLDLLPMANVHHIGKLDQTPTINNPDFIEHISFRYVS